MHPGALKVQRPTAKSLKHALRSRRISEDSLLTTFMEGRIAAGSSCKHSLKAAYHILLSRVESKRRVNWGSSCTAPTFPVCLSNRMGTVKRVPGAAPTRRA